MSRQRTVARKRFSDNPRAKRQQRCRRRRSLLKKAYEYGVNSDADVYMVLRIRKDGQIYIFNRDSSVQWIPPLQELVCPTVFIYDLQC